MASLQYTIQPEDKLLRKAKLPPYADGAMEFVKILPNGQKQVRRLTFRPHPETDKDGLSVSIVALVKSVYLLFNKATHLAAVVTSKQCTDLGLTVKHNPCSEEPENPLYAHALVKGLNGRKDLQATLAEKCVIIE